MKKSLITIASLVALSGSAFAATNSATVDFSVNVTPTCTFKNLAGASLTGTAASGDASLDLGTVDLKYTCSLGQEFIFYVNSNAVTLTEGNPAKSNGEKLVVRAHEQTIAGPLVNLRADALNDRDIGTGVYDTIKTVAFQVKPEDNQYFRNKHVGDTGSMTFTFEYEPDSTVTP